MTDRIIDGRYRLRHELGGGAVGTVFLAEDIQLQRAVAIKLVDLPETEREEVFVRLQREARALNLFVHPNIVQILRIGRENVNQVYLVMEYVKGRSLHDLLASGPLSFGEVIDLGTQICRALLHSEQQGVVHRDVKPQNVLIAENDRTGSVEAKLADFGLCKLDDAANELNLTKTGVTLGTPQYMSPEQCYGHEVDHRSDIYSFGCVLFEMLTGKPPFAAEMPAQLLMMHVTIEPPRILDQSPRCGLPEALQSIYLTCMEKRKEYRFQSFQEVLTALEAVGPVPSGKRLADNEARSTTGDTGVRRSSRKWKIAAAAGCILALGACAIVFGASPQLLASIIVKSSTTDGAQNPVAAVERSLGMVTRIRGADVALEVAEDTMVAAEEQGWSQDEKFELLVSNFEFFRQKNMLVPAAAFAEQALMSCLDDLSKCFRGMDKRPGNQAEDLTEQKQKVMLEVLEFYLTANLPRESWSSLVQRIGGYNSTLSPQELIHLPPSRHVMIYGDVVARATELSSTHAMSRPIAQRLQDFYQVSGAHADALDDAAAFNDYMRKMLRWSLESHDRIGEITAHCQIGRRAVRKNRFKSAVAEQRIIDEIIRRDGLKDRPEWHLNLPAPAAAKK